MFRKKSYPSCFGSPEPIYYPVFKTEEVVIDDRVVRHVYRDDVNLCSSENFSDIPNASDTQLDKLINAGVPLESVNCNLLNPSDPTFIIQSRQSIDNFVSQFESKSE